MRTSYFISKLDALLYPKHQDNWDNKLFRNRILSIIHSNPKAMDVLDLGAGAGIVKEMNFYDEVKQICGIDPDPRVCENTFLHEARIGHGEAIPYPNERFDLVFADNVLEHLPDPVAVFKEVQRVLRSNGVFIAKTPNKWHYMPIAARLTPHWFHVWYEKIRGRQEDDIFPTLYRANSERDVKIAAKAAQLDVEIIEFIEGRPEYLRVSSVSYIFGWVYERIVNFFASLMRFRILIVVRLKKVPINQ